MTIAMEQEPDPEVPGSGWDEYVKTGYKKGDEARAMKRIEAQVLANPDTPFTWAQIQRDALDERKARFTQFASQKNSEMLDWFFDNPPEELPSDLLRKTQGYSKNTHPLEVHND